MDLTGAEGEDYTKTMDMANPDTLAFLEDILKSKEAQEKEEAKQSSFLESIKDWNLIEIPSDGNCLFYAMAWFLWGKFDRTLAQKVRNSLANLWQQTLICGRVTSQNPSH